MDSIAIERALCSTPASASTFWGVYAANRLPTVVRTRPATVIVNFDEDYLPGSHWGCFYLPVSPQGVEFFDSLGYSPTLPWFASFAARHGGFISWNDRRCQSEKSDVCGEYVCLFSLHKSLGFCTPSFMRLFGHDSSRNDTLVLDLFNRRFTCVTHFARPSLRAHHVQTCSPACHTRGARCPSVRGVRGVRGAHEVREPREQREPLPPTGRTASAGASARASGRAGKR